MNFIMAPFSFFFIIKLLLFYCTMAASGHGMASPHMRTFAQRKVRLRSPRERRGTIATVDRLYHGRKRPWYGFLPHMRTFAQRKVRLRSPRERRGTIATLWLLYHGRKRPWYGSALICVLSRREGSLRSPHERRGTMATLELVPWPQAAIVWLSPQCVLSRRGRFAYARRAKDAVIQPPCGYCTIRDSLKQRSFFLSLYKRFCIIKINSISR